MDIILDMGNV